MLRVWRPTLSYFNKKAMQPKALAPLSPQPNLELVGIQSLRNQPFRSPPLLRSPEYPVARGILHQLLHFPRRGAILPLADASRFVGPPRENARSGLVAVSDADLEGVIVEPSNSRGGTTVVFLVEKLK